MNWSVTIRGTISVHCTTSISGTLSLGFTRREESIRSIIHGIVSGVAVTSHAMENSSWHGWTIAPVSRLKADSHVECRAYALPLPCHAAKGFRMCPSHLIYAVRPCLFHTCHAAPMSCSDHTVLLKVTALHGRRETACELPARVRLLPVTTRSSTKIFIRSIPNLLTKIHTYDCKEWYQHTTKNTIC
jgi:hypothetical protein